MPGAAFGWLNFPVAAAVVGACGEAKRWGAVVARVASDLERASLSH